MTTFINPNIATIIESNWDNIGSYHFSTIIGNLNGRALGGQPHLIAIIGDDPETSVAFAGEIHSDGECVDRVDWEPYDKETALELIDEHDYEENIRVESKLIYWGLNTTPPHVPPLSRGMRSWVDNIEDWLTGRDDDELER